jgi:hypothetical protein
MVSLLSILSILAAAPPVVHDRYQAPGVEGDAPLVAVVYMLVVLAGICVLGFKSAHRTHLK